MKKQNLNVLSNHRLAAACSILGLTMTLSAQNVTSFSFEDGLIPEQWTTEQATVAISEEHASAGSKSLEIGVEAGKTAKVEVTFNPFNTSSARMLSLDIYSLAADGTPLKVEFLNAADEPQQSGNVVLNFKGWMPYNRNYYSDYAVRGNGLTKMRLTIDNSASVKPLKLFLDNVEVYAKAADYIAQPLVVKDVDLLKRGDISLLKLFSYECDIERTPLNTEEENALTSIKAMFPYAPDAAASETDLQSARDYVASLGIGYNQDGTVNAAPIIKSASEATVENQILLLQRLSALQASSADGDYKLASDLLAVILDQNVMYRYPRLQWHVYSEVRLIPRLLLAAMSIGSEEQKSEILKAVRWMTEAGWAYVADDYMSTHYNSDILYLGMNYYLSCAAYEPDVQKAVQEMKGVAQMLEKAVAPRSGGYEIVKPDGLGFHHGTHYIAYMYAFNQWVNAAYILRTTPFHISETAFQSMKKVVLASLAISNRSNAGANYYAKSLAGRHPFTGQHNQFFPYVVDQFIEVSAALHGSIDTELAAAYNYYMLSDKYSVPAMDFAGFYQYNYSPIGIYRGDDWVVTMRSPTTLIWGAEIYNGYNRFGRYQSHGSMEVVYNGALSNSGLPSEGVGYDWNVVPGTTTVHYGSWADMMPKKNRTQRFDQFTATKNYAGALTWGKCGIFSCDFDQGDKRNNTTCFTATNLVFRKTVFAVDGLLVNIGSGITSSGSYADNWITATNLFQEVGDDLTPFVVNGKMMNNGDADRVIDCGESDAWLITPKGTGYLVPKGNDGLTVKFGMQEGPKADGSDYANPAKALGAKAYLNHGVKPTDASYTFVMVPGATQERLMSLAASIRDRFTVLSQTGSIHGFHYRPDSLTALSFFEAVSETGLDMVKATGSEMLVMYQPQAGGALRLAVCNPNLYPKKISTTLGDWTVSPTETSVTLAGAWRATDMPEGVSVQTPADGVTKIDMTLHDGLSVYLDLVPGEFGGVDEVIAGNDSSAPAEVFNLNGVKVGTDTQSLAPGVYIVKQGVNVRKILVR